MEEALEEVANANANATMREKVVAILKSMTLDSLPLPPNSSNLQVVMITLSQ